MWICTEKEICWLHRAEGARKRKEETMRRKRICDDVKGGHPVLASVWLFKPKDDSSLTQLNPEILGDCHYLVRSFFVGMTL